MDPMYADLDEIAAFDERLGALANLIGSVTRPGDYCTWGRLFAPMPRVETRAAGALSFPIPPAQVRALIAGAERAPCGRGEETVVDRSVRDCWQVAPDAVDVGGRTWTGTFRDILDRTTEGLGYPRGALEATPYKLLVYEAGGFFASHRDTEKADGMVATLVVSLPVAGTGGDLVIRHRGRETVVDMRTDEPSELVHAAFYADCEHEIRPVAAGHRVCLVYNLTLRDGGGGVETGAPDYGALIVPLAAELEARCRDPGASGKLVWLLEHDYSAAGLSFGALKNVDAAVGRVLSAAAERAGCALHAAVVRVEETGSGWYHGYAREVEDIDDDAFELYEIVDTACWLDGWMRPDGAPAPYGALPLLAGESMPADRLDPGRPDTQRLTEASGNEGATIERFYRRAALAVWRKPDCPRVLAPGGAGSLAAFLADEWRRASSGAPASGPIHDVASRVVDVWPPPGGHGMRPEREGWERHSADVLELLCAIGNRDATRRFLDRVALPHYGGGLNAALAVAAAEIGAAEMREFLCALVRSHIARETEGILDLSARLCARLDGSGDGAWRDTLREAAAAVCAGLPSVGREPEGGEDEDDRAGPGVRPARRTPLPLPPAAVRQLFALLWRLGLDDEADAAAALLVERPDLVSPDRAIPVVLGELLEERGAKAATGTAFATLWRRGARFLMSRSGTPPAAPTDWTIPADGLSCDCEHCAGLRRFCADPDAEACRIPVRKELRAHLRRRIALGGLDIRCETERKGRPYTLVCVKTRATYERRLRQYGEDIAAMRRLVGTAEAVPGSADTTRRLRASIARRR